MRRLRTLLTGVTAPFLLAGLALAQEPETAPNTETVSETEQEAEEEEAPSVAEEITVTGTKADLSLQETVTSVSVFNSERIEREAVFELDDILLRTANVSTNGGTNSLSIRGVRRFGVAGGTGVTSNVYVDGAPLSNLGANGLESLWDVEQVEVLRGPQSTVQGRNSLAGAIVINSKRPTFQLENDFRVRFGELGTRQYSAALGGPLTTETLAGRISANVQEFEGNVRYAAPGRSNGELAHVNDGATIRGQLLWIPKAVSGLSWNLIVERTDTDTRDNLVQWAPGPPGSPEFEAWDPFGNEGYQVPQSFEYELTRFVTELNYTLSDRFTLVGLATYEDTIQDRLFGNPDNPVEFDTNATFDSDTQTMTGELRLEFGGDKLSGRAGAYYFEDDADQLVTASVALNFLPVIPSTSIGIIEGLSNPGTENYAFFGELRYEINDSWVIEAGLRYDNESFDTTGFQLSGSINPPDCVVAPFIPGIGGLPCIFLLRQPPAQPLTAEFDALLPRVALTHNFDDNRSISLAVQEGYRAGGSFLFIDSQSADQTPVLETFDPEFLTNYEIAFRSQWFDRKVTLNANAFYSDWRDQQVFIPGPVGINDGRTENVGASELLGMELETRWQVNPNVELFTALGYTKTEFTDFPFSVDQDGNVIDPEFAFLDGNEFQTAPNFTGSIGAYYNNQKGYFGDVTVSHTDSSFSDIFNLPIDEVEAVTITNLRIGYGRDKWRAYIFANNLFDERIQTFRNFANVNQDGTLDTFTPGATNVNRPRVVGLAIDFSF
ncbi:MAG: TonB-dependent receptor [Acidobacteriota bacterium]